jgi:two-component system, cell cycle sensor histidine kinase PleC
MPKFSSWLDRQFSRSDSELSLYLAAGSASRWIAANGVVALGYFGLGFIVSRFFVAYGLFPAPIWLPASVAVVAVLIGGWRLMPGIFIGSFCANAVLFDPPLHITSIISATNMLGPAIGVLVLHRLARNGRLFTSFHGVVAFLATTTLLSPAISSAGGAAAMSIGAPFDPAQFTSIWLNWMVTDSGGTLYLAPAILLWLGVDGANAASTDGKKQKPLSARRSDIVACLCVMAPAMALFLFPGSLPLGQIRVLIPFLLVVPLSWITLRVALRSAYTLVSLLSIMATAGAVAGVGPFQDSTLANPLQLVGLLVVVLAMNVLSVAALSIERQQAQAAKLAESMLLARTSHELRTPLNAVIGFSSLIDRQALGPLANEKYLEYARIIQSSGEHLLALINDLIDLSKIDSGHYEMKEENVDIAAAIAEATVMIDVQAKSRSIALSSETHCDGVAVAADARALWQVLINILSNAVKFTPEGGCVTVRSMLDAAGNLSIRVTDTGFGIAPDDLARLGTPFERAAPSSGDAVEGTGLGLSIAKGLIALHGGSIELRSTVGEGTEATIRLPARRVRSAMSTRTDLKAQLPLSA